MSWTLVTKKLMSRTEISERKQWFSVNDMNVANCEQPTKTLVNVVMCSFAEREWPDAIRRSFSAIHAGIRGSK